MRTEKVFRDRRAAGGELAAALQYLRAADPVVLALPRGGVPVGFEVARGLDAPLDVLLVRKLGAPGEPELGLGAVVDGADPHVVLNEEILAEVAPPEGYVEAETQRQLAEIERRRRRYRGSEPALPVKDRTVIVVDDGIATGGTMKAALRGLRASGPRRLVMAVPVAPADTLQAMAAECDEIVCLATPALFHVVGAHYLDFTQTTDEEVVQLLAKARRPGPGRKP